jgi:hypothetical protein
LRSSLQERFGACLGSGTRGQHIVNEYNEFIFNPLSALYFSAQVGFALLAVEANLIDKAMPPSQCPPQEWQPGAEAKLQGQLVALIEAALPLADRA